MSSLFAAMKYTAIMKQLNIDEKQRFTATEHEVTLWTASAVTLGTEL
jgi:hypothetical protein